MKAISRNLLLLAMALSFGALCAVQFSFAQLPTRFQLPNTNCTFVSTSGLRTNLLTVVGAKTNFFTTTGQGGKTNYHVIVSCKFNESKEFVITVTELTGLTFSSH